MATFPSLEAGTCWDMVAIERKSKAKVTATLSGADLAVESDGWYGSKLVIQTSQFKMDIPKFKVGDLAMAKETGWLLRVNRVDIDYIWCIRAASGPYPPTHGLRYRAGELQLLDELDFGTVNNNDNEED